jgi:putative aldouronate transport system substrate-binding protein
LASGSGRSDDISKERYMKKGKALAVALLVMLLSQGAVWAAASDPVTLRFVRAGNEQDPEKDRILLELQKRLNIKLEIVSIPWDQFPSKLNIMIAAGEQIDFANCDAGKTLNEWAQNGILFDYDSLLKSGKYPYVASVVNADLYKGLKIGGKSYYKPLGLCSQQWGYLVRKDWLDKLGLKVPSTPAELRTVIAAFKEKDPDGNGKADTYGWYARESGEADYSWGFAAVNFAYAVNGAVKNWVQLPDGSITRWEMSEAAKKAALFVHKLSKDGLINKDWLTLKRDSAQGPESDEFAAGRYGIARTSIPDVFVSKLQAMNPNAKVVFLPPMGGEAGVPQNSGANGGYWWGTVIPKTSKHPEKVLELLDYCLTKEGRELTEFGIKGTHFASAVDSGDRRIYTINKAECDKDWDTKKNGYLYPLTWGAFNYYEYAYIPIKESGFNYDKAFSNVQSWLPSEMSKGDFSTWQAMNSRYSVSSPLMNVFDDRLLGDANKLLSIFNEGWLMSVLGTDADFDKNWSAMKAKWLKAGGDEIIKYGQEYYKAHK